MVVMKKLIVICFLTSSVLMGQNFKHDIKAVINSMVNASNYSMKMNYQLFVDDNMQQPFQQSWVDVKRYGDNLYTNYGNNFELLQTQNYELAINNHDKTLLVKQLTTNNSLPVSKAREQFGDISLLADSLAYIYQTVRVLSSSNNIIVYELKYKQNATMLKTLIEIDKNIMSLLSITHYYKKVIKVKELDNDDHKVAFRINYMNYHKGQFKDKSLFDEKKFITVRNGKIKTASKYSSFKINILK